MQLLQFFHVERAVDFPADAHEIGGWLEARVVGGGIGSHLAASGGRARMSRPSRSTVARSWRAIVTLPSLTVPMGSERDGSPFAPGTATTRS